MPATRQPAKRPARSARFLFRFRVRENPQHKRSHVACGGGREWSASGNAYGWNDKSEQESMK